MAKTLLLEPFDGIQSATQVKRTKAVATAHRGRLLSWLRSDHSRYTLRDVDPSKPINLAKEVFHWDQQSYLPFFWYKRSLQDDLPADTPAGGFDNDSPDDVDMSAITIAVPWAPSPWSP